MIAKTGYEQSHREDVLVRRTAPDLEVYAGGDQEENPDQGGGREEMSALGRWLFLYAANTAATWGMAPSVRGTQRAEHLMRWDSCGDQ